MRSTKKAMLSLLLLVSLILITALPESVTAADTDTPKVVFLGKPIDGMLYLGDDNTVLANTSKGKIYFLDLQGKVLLSTKQLDKIVKKAGGSLRDGYTALNFSEGYAMILCTAAKAGDETALSIYFDKTGKIAFSAPGEGSYVRNGVAIVNTSSGSIDKFSRAYDTQGNLIASIKGDNGTFVGYGNGIYLRDFEGLNKFVDNNNVSVIKGYFTDTRAFDNSLIAPAADANYKYGFLNSKGEVVIDFKFGGVGGLDPKTKNYFNEGLCAVADSETGLWGYIDTTGKLVIPCKFESADPFENGLARIRSQSTDGMHSGKLGYIDTTGKVVIPTNYYFMTTMINGYCLGENDDGCTIYDATGKAYKTQKMDLGYIDTRKDVSVFIYDAPGDKKGMATIQ